MNNKQKPTGEKQPSSRRHSHRGSSHSSQSGPLKLLSLPWRFLRNIIRHWSPAGAIRSLWNGSRRFVAWLAIGPGQAQTIRETSRKESHLEWPSKSALKNPVSWCNWTASAAIRWVTTLPLRQLVLAAPALVFVVGFLSTISWGNMKAAKNLDGRYARHFLTAVKNDDIPGARIALDRLIQLKPDDLSIAENRAVFEDQHGDKELAKQMMADLANFQNSSPAAMWLAANLGSKKEMRTWPKEKLQTYVDWLVKATNNASENSGPRLELSDLLAAMGDFPRAHAVLAPLAHSNVEAAYRTITLEERMGQRASARRRAGPLAIALQRQLISTPKALLVRVRCAELLGLQGRTEESVSTLRDGIVHAAGQGERVALEDFLVKALVRDAARKTRLDGTPADLLNKFKTLRDAAEMRPNSPLVMQAITEICIASHKHSTADVILGREKLYAFLPDEKVRFIEGTAALQSGKIDAAKKLLAVNPDASETSPGMLNNLAHAILQEDNGDMKKALELSNAALKGFPGHPYLHETRGQILFRIGRYQEAVPDFKQALLAPDLRSAVRKTLADVFDKLDQPDAAREQRQLLAEENAAQVDGQETPDASPQISDK